MEELNPTTKKRSKKLYEFNFKRAYIWSLIFIFISFFCALADFYINKVTIPAIEFEKTTLLGLLSIFILSWKQLKPEYKDTISGPLPSRTNQNPDLENELIDHELNHKQIYFESGLNQVLGNERDISGILSPITQHDAHQLVKALFDIRDGMDQEKLDFYNNNPGRARVALEIFFGRWTNRNEVHFPYRHMGSYLKVKDMHHFILQDIQESTGLPMEDVLNNLLDCSLIFIRNHKNIEVLNLKDYCTKYKSFEAIYNVIDAKYSPETKN